MDVTSEHDITERVAGQPQQRSARGKGRAAMDLQHAHKRCKEGPTEAAASAASAAADGEPPAGVPARKTGSVVQWCGRTRHFAHVVTKCAADGCPVLVGAEAGRDRFDTRGTKAVRICQSHRSHAAQFTVNGGFAVRYCSSHNRLHTAWVGHRTECPGNWVSWHTQPSAEEPWTQVDGVGQDKQAQMHRNGDRLILPHGFAYVADPVIKGSRAVPGAAYISSAWAVIVTGQTADAGSAQAVKHHTCTGQDAAARIDPVVASEPVDDQHLSVCGPDGGSAAISRSTDMILSGDPIKCVGSDDAIDPYSAFIAAIRDSTDASANGAVVPFTSLIGATAVDRKWVMQKLGSD